MSIGFNAQVSEITLFIIEVDSDINQRSYIDLCINATASVSESQIKYSLRYLNLVNRPPR